MSSQTDKSCKANVQIEISKMWFDLIPYKMGSGAMAHNSYC